MNATAAPQQTVPQQTIVTLDLEGVLVPEIWIAVAERTGIEALRRTTRDEPDYDVLMKGRLALLAQHGLRMSTITDVIAGLEPMDGARDFLDALRARTQVIILSDTFEQFAAPLMRQLGMAAIFCHRVVAAGDSHNDSAMLGAADAGFWFHAPDATTAQFPQFPANHTYDQLLTTITASLSQ